MSIFASWGAPSDDEHTDDCARWEKDGDMWDISDRPCDCGQPDSPLVYAGSHILPSEEDPRGGWVDIASIPSHITRDGRDDRPEDEAPWPFLRFGVNEGTVILTRRNVEQVAEALNEWLASTTDELGSSPKDLPSGVSDGTGTEGKDAA